MLPGSLSASTLSAFPFLRCAPLRQAIGKRRPSPNPHYSVLISWPAISAPLPGTDDASGWRAMSHNATAAHRILAWRNVHARRMAFMRQATSQVAAVVSCQSGVSTVLRACMHLSSYCFIIFLCVAMSLAARDCVWPRQRQHFLQTPMPALSM